MQSVGVDQLAKLSEGMDVGGFALAVMSGNVSVARQLLALGADPNARIPISYHTLGIVEGMTPLHFAVTGCATHNQEMVELLVRAKANVNARLGGGKMTALMAAANFNPDGVRALLPIEGLHIDQRGVNGDTALGLAAFQGPTECVRALLDAQADVTHIKATGSTHLMSACDNPGVSEQMLELLWADGAVDINACRVPQTAWWGAICRLFEFLHRRGARGDLVMAVAHMRGGTALHEAALKGNELAVKWLLEHGAHRSLFKKNRLGYLPLDVARCFGPL